MATSAFVRPRLVFPLAMWDGPSGVTFIQFLLRDPITGVYFIGQADEVPGQGSKQNTVIRRTLPNLQYVDSRTVVKGGHGSSCGIEHDADKSWLVLGHDEKGVGRFSYNEGMASWQPIKVLPNGDVSVHRNVICIREGNTFTGYDYAQAKAGKRVQLFKFRIPGWGNRFQGHAVISFGDGTGRVLVHRDMATKGQSLAVAFDFKGNEVDSLDTTKFGDEAEGFLIEVDAKGSVTAWIVKRTGGNNKNRVVVATYWFGNLNAKPTVPIDLTKGINRVFVLLGQPSAMKLGSLLTARKNGNTSRYTFYAQSWLIALGYYKGLADGRWGKATQAAFDNFRRGIKPAWPESDCVGPPGITSLTLLRNAAVKKTGKDTLKVTP